jgi:hypothetical protein
MTRYEPASPSPTATSCQTGTVALGRAIKTVWPPLVVMSGPFGCFNARRIAGSRVWSLHAEGRALDVGCGVDHLEVGWDCACHLTASHITTGVQRVMWQGHIWSIEHAGSWRQLAPSAEQHMDHLHVEQRWSAARQPAEIHSVYEAALRVPIPGPSAA